MTSAKLKEKIHRHVDHADDRFLKVVYAMLEEYVNSENDIAVVTTAGEPLSKNEYVSRVKEISNRAKKGKKIPHEQLRKESEKW